MRKLRAGLALALSACIPSAPAQAQVRGVAVDPAGPQVQTGPAGIGSGLSPQAVSLPSLSLGSLSLAPALPSAKGPSPAPGLAPAQSLQAAPARRTVSALPAAPAPAALKAAALPPSSIPQALPSPRAAALSAAPAAVPARAPFAKKLAAISGAAAEAGKAMAAPAATAGQSSVAAERQFRALTGEPGSAPAEESVLRVDGLDFSEAELSQVRRTNAALESAVGSALAPLLPGTAVQVLSRGSSARMTHADGRPDYDLNARLPESMDNAAVGRFVHDNLAAITQGLADAVRRETASLYAGPVEVLVGKPKWLSDPATGKPAEGVFLFEVSVRGPSGTLLDADVTITSRKDYANEYPAYFAAQLEQVRRAGGPAAVEKTLRDIRLAKRLFNVLIGSYKPWHGGPSGVGVEQLILQSGKVSDADRGRTILEPGSFDKFMERIAAAAFEADGSPRGLRKARRLWTVHNPFMQPASFLDLLSDGAWKQLSHAARTYVEARREGRTVDLQDLRYDKPEPPAPPPVKPPERKVEVLEAAPNEQVRLSFRSSLARAKWARMAGALQAQLRGKGIPVVGLDFVSEAGGLAAVLDAAPTADLETAQAALRALLKREDPRAIDGLAIKGVSERPVPEATLVVLPRAGRLPDGHGIDRLVRGLSRRLDLAPRGRGYASGSLVLSFSGKIEDRESFIKAASDYLAARSGGLELSSVAFSKQVPLTAMPAPVETPPAAGAQASGRSAAPVVLAAAPDGPGSLTLGMLRKFTMNGPAPEARGPEYLYAQGARVLPQGLEASRYDGRAQPTQRTEQSQTLRTLLQRRGGRVFVMVPTFNEEGMEVYKPLKLAPAMARGIVSDSMVEVSYDGKRVLSVRSIGAYPADMLIGRAVRQGRGLGFTGLFGSEDAVRALYPPMPLVAPGGDALGGRSLSSPGEGVGLTVHEGDIVQVFVRDGAGGPEAVALIPLGREVTPEIAAREIALRHGARGYFDEGVVRQAEAVGRAQDPEADFRRMREAKGRVEDLRALSFVTIDPVGAGDLDDAFAVEKNPDGSYTWYLATADVAQYVKPGTPAFGAAARIGNTFYSIDKGGVPEFPMNHPVVSKYVASLLAGKDSLAMITKMRFSPTGEFLLKDSEVFLGLVSVKGRYTYDQVAALWKGRTDHGILHTDQVALARELAGKLNLQDTERGKLKLFFTQYEHRKGPGGGWATEAVEEDLLLGESHRLIEELKVYGNRVIATRLDRITEQFKVPHVSRVHPPAEDTVNERLHKELSDLGAPWPKNIPLWRYLDQVHQRADLSPEKKEVIATLALRSRSSALYSLDDSEGHEGLALQAREYDHPSTPIRRFSDMYNRAILEAYLESGDPRPVYEAVLKDLKAMGFESFEEYLQHLNGREQAAKHMDFEVDEFMSVYMLAKPENQGRTFAGYVKLIKEGKNAEAVIQLRDIPASITLRGGQARGYKLLQEVQVLVRKADVNTLEVDAKISRGK